MSKYLFLPLLCLLSACQVSPKLTEGRWSGHLSPMNHPEMENPVSYKVTYTDDRLSISILDPGGALIPTNAPRLEGDTLFFSFNEPEEQVLLNCVLAKNNKKEYSGRCQDSEGKWAQFTMIPPG